MMFVYIFLAILCSVHGGVTKDVEEKAGCGGDLNAEFSTCPPPLACQFTCGSRRDDCSPVCLEPGCVCKRGFVFNEKYGKCTRSEECTEVKCEDENAEYKRCPTRCDRPTCYSKDSNWCYEKPQPCEPPSCRCKHGFVLDELSGKCIDPDSCPVIGCGGDVNAEFKMCSPPRDCDRRCNDGGPTDYICLPVCTNPRCVCKTGFVLNENGKCVAPWNCPA